MAPQASPHHRPTESYMVESDAPVGILMERVGVAIFSLLYGMTFRTELSWSLSDVFEFRRLPPTMQGTLVAERRRNQAGSGCDRY